MFIKLFPCDDGSVEEEIKDDHVVPEPPLSQVRFARVVLKELNWPKTS